MKSRFLDPLYGVVHTDEFETSLLLTPEIQRLRYVRMCNINSLQIMGASETSRFEHIVGVLHLAKLWATKNCPHPHDQKILHAAAILHDLQTGPFGHSLEYILDDNEVEGDFDHENVERAARESYLQDIQAGASFRGAQFRAKVLLGGDWINVAETIKGAGKLGPILSAQLDIDNIDNVVRLAYHVGIIDQKKAQRIAEELIGELSLSKGGALLVSLKGAKLIEEWQKVRSDLYLLLLHDWAEFSAKAMLTKVIETAVQLEKLSVDNWILTDDGLIDHLSKELTGEGGPAKEILDRLVRGALYEPVLLASLQGTNDYDMLAKVGLKRKIEDEISSLIGAKTIFHVIKDKNKTFRSIQCVLADTGSTIQIGNSSDETLVGVFSSKPIAGQKATKQIHDAVSRILKSHNVCGALEDLPDPTDRFVRAGVQEMQLGLFDET